MAIPHHAKYSIGEVAKLCGVSVRTLQYYDNIGLLPTGKDASGRRCYGPGDLAKLQQVLFYRSLGLPLKEIQELVVEAASPEQIAAVLREQREVFFSKLNEIQGCISLIDAILAGIKSGGAAPSDQWIQLIAKLNRNAVFEFRNVRFNKETKELLMGRYADGETALADYWHWKALILECVSLILCGVSPRSEAGKQFARKWLAMIDRLTEGRGELLEAHKEAYENRTQWPEEDRRLMEFADPFIDEAVAYWLDSADSRNVSTNDPTNVSTNASTYDSTYDSANLEGGDPAE